MPCSQAIGLRFEESRFDPFRVGDEPPRRTRAQRECQCHDKDSYGVYGNGGVDYPIIAHLCSCHLRGTGIAVAKAGDSVRSLLSNYLEVEELRKALKELGKRQINRLV
jgi:hypothetical protein